MDDKQFTKDELLKELDALRDHFADFDENKQRQVANELLYERDFRESLFEFSPNYMVVIDADGKTLRVNQAMLHALGYEEHELVGRDYLKTLVPSDEHSELINIFRQLTTPKEHTVNENHVVTKDGRQLLVEWYGCNLPIKKGGKKHFFGVGVDVTARRSAERALEESQRMMHTLLSNLPGIAYRCKNDENYTMVFISEGITPLTGYLPEDIIGNQKLSYTSLIDPNYREYVWEDIQKAVAAHEPFQLEYQIKTRDGETKWVWERGRGVYDKDGKLEALEGFVMDVTREVQANENLAAEKERLDVTLRSIGDAVITTDMEGRITLINQVAAELTGWSQDEAIQRPLSEVFRIVDEQTREPVLNPFARVIREGQIMDITQNTMLIARDGTERILADSAAPIRMRNGKIIGVILVFRDITERYKLEGEMLRAQKLESIGMLAGGIAHDFNNILTSVMGNITLAALQAGEDEEIVTPLKEAEAATLRAKDLTQQLLTFSRGGSPIRQVTSIGTLIQETSTFTLRGSNVKCECDITPDLWSVEIDRGQMSQVLSCLLINADQAMPDGGIAYITANNVAVTDDDQMPFAAGHYIRLTVTDHGIGIADENRSKIFDPYFTTKQTGSGLGLAIAYSIIKKHNGFIDVESEKGVGTTFTIYLPAFPQEDVINGKEEKPIGIKPDKILLMDDEELILRVGKELLTHLSYHVECANDGKEALLKYAEAMKAGEPFDVVIMDLTIPGGMGGKETIAKLLEIDPQARAVVSSGYSNDPIMAGYADFGFKGVVAKPYRIEDLDAVLHKAMASD